MPTLGPKDGSFTLQYRSAVALGKAEIVTDEAKRNWPCVPSASDFCRSTWTSLRPAIARSLNRTAVVRITLTEEPRGKRKQYDSQGDEMKWGRME